jgi:hypothetical protein
MDKHDQDLKFMKEAIDWANDCRPVNESIPRVGAIIAVGDEVLGRGRRGTGRQGDDEHAEVNALNEVANKSLLTQATLYTTLGARNKYSSTKSKGFLSVFWTPIRVSPEKDCRASKSTGLKLSSFNTTSPKKFGSKMRILSVLNRHWAPRLLLQNTVRNFGPIFIRFVSHASIRRDPTRIYSAIEKACTGRNRVRFVQTRTESGKSTPILAAQENIHSNW